MALTPEDVAHLVRAATAAAESASKAALAAERASQSSKGTGRAGFSEASKVCKCPDSFGGGTVEDDQTKWADFSMAFKAWLYYGDEMFRTDLEDLEATKLGKATVLSAWTDEAKVRSKQLYSILCGILKGRALQVLRATSEQHGYEVWRQLVNLYSPHTKQRSLGIMTALMSFPSFSKDRSYLEQIQGLDRLAEEFRKSSGKAVQDEMMLGILTKALPAHVRQQVQLSMSESSTYAEVRERVLSFETVSHVYNASKIQQEFGVGAVYNGPQPMEIDLVSKGKGKWWTKNNQKGDYKGKKGDGTKGGHKDDRTNKGKGKGDKSGSGKASADKGKAKGQGQDKVPKGNCLYCGKPGHWKKDCWQAKRDGAVRAVTESDEPNTQQQTSAAASSSVSQSSASQAGAIRRVLQSSSAPRAFAFFDLTSQDECYKGSVRMVEQYDMSYSDNDEQWTECGDIELILDSGADHSALPLRFASIGKPAGDSGHTFVDAQGNDLPVAQVRVAEVALGDMCFKENFIIAPVNNPLLCLGRLYKAGFEVRKWNDQLQLGCEDHAVPVEFRRNSLAVQGSIRMLEQARTGTDERLHVRAITLRSVLANLPTDGSLVQVGEAVYARCGFSANYINTTLLPLQSLLWRRTTLVKRVGQGWDLIEFCEDISKLDDYEAGLPNPQNIELVMTIAHDHEVSPEELGFEFDAEPGEAMPRHGVSLHAGVGVVDESQEPEQAEAVPAAPDEAEVPVEQRHVPLADNEVEIDGVRLDLNSTLQALRAGCVALGLTKRGSKQQCLERLRRHIQEHALLAEHQAVAAAVGDSERKPRGVTEPGSPTPEQVATHCITHQPYRSWCGLCVAHRARQDAHHDLNHAHTSESVVSVDFGFCKRQETEAHLLTVLVVHDRHSKAVHVIPSLSKGGQSLSYLTTELTRFVAWLGHREVCFKSDGEPAIKAVVRSAERACRQLGIKVRSVTTPVEDHEANGAVEQAWKSIRAHAGVMVSQVETNGGAEGRVVFGSLHPFYMWCLVHSAWIHNRFVVQHSLTAFERVTASQYVGRICCYGEVVLGYLRTSAKAGARWCKGVWLGKTTQNDTHIIATDQGLFLTRSVRRLVEQDRWSLERCGEVTLAPWEHGFASLGGKLVVNKRIVAPQVAARLRILHLVLRCLELATNQNGSAAQAKAEGPAMLRSLRCRPRRGPQRCL